MSYSTHDFETPQGDERSVTSEVIGCCTYLTLQLVMDEHQQQVIAMSK